MRNVSFLCALLLAPLSVEAQAAPATPAADGFGGLMSFLPMILIVVVGYFLIFRPQQKRDRALKEMQASLKVGARVLTSSGIFGRISRLLNEQEAILDVGEGIKMTFLRSSIIQVLDVQNVEKKESISGDEGGKVTPIRAARKAPKNGGKGVKSETGPKVPPSPIK